MEHSGNHPSEMQSQNAINKQPPPPDSQPDGQSSMPQHSSAGQDILISNPDHRPQFVDPPPQNNLAQNLDPGPFEEIPDYIETSQHKPGDKPIRIPRPLDFKAPIKAFPIGSAQMGPSNEAFEHSIPKTTPPKHDANNSTEGPEKQLAEKPQGQISEQRPKVYIRRQESGSQTPLQRKLTNGQNANVQNQSHAGNNGVQLDPSRHSIRAETSASFGNAPREDPKEQDQTPQSAIPGHQPEAKSLQASQIPPKNLVIPITPRNKETANPLPQNLPPISKTRPQETGMNNPTLPPLNSHRLLRPIDVPRAHRRPNRTSSTLRTPATQQTRSPTSQTRWQSTATLSVDCPDPALAEEVQGKHISLKKDDLPNYSLVACRSPSCRTSSWATTRS